MFTFSRQIEDNCSGMVILVMGVAGSGKSCVGKLLAQSLGCPFIDADEYHPAANIEKMSHGIPLNDADRQPWLDALRAAIAERLGTSDVVVLACSALKQRYRDYLARGTTMSVVYLKGDRDLLWRRLSERQAHFMRPEMLASQLADLEEPADALVVDVAEAPEAIVASLHQRFLEFACGPTA